MNLTIDKVELPESSELALEDKWILTKFEELTANVVSALDRYEVGVALSSLYDFTWDIFCDWYIELAKARLNAKDTKENIICQNVISYVLIGTLKLLHPFMPFITEEIYQSMPHECESIMISEYPSYDESLTFSAESAEMTKIIDAIKAIRARRSEMNVPPSRKAKIYIATRSALAFNAQTAVFFERLASASEVIVAEDFESSTVSADNAVQIVTDAATIFLPLSDIIDFEKERARLAGEQKRLLGEIERIEKKLSNQGFVAKAPAAVVDGERQKLQKYKEMLDGVEEAIKKLK